MSLPKRPVQLWDPPSLLFNGYNGFLLQRVTQPEREADLSPPSSASDKNEWSYTYHPRHMSS
jgi:hypothetical protein